MEPHAAQDRLSFVCNWKHMHCEAKSKAEPPQPTGPHTTTTSTSPSLPPGLGCHILVEAKWQVTLQSLRAFIELTDLALHVKFSSMGRLYRVSCKSFKPWDWNLSGSWESTEEGGLDIGSDMLWEHKQYCTVHSPRSVMSGRDRPRMQSRGITSSYIRERLHKGRMYDIY